MTSPRTDTTIKDALSGEKNDIAEGLIYQIINHPKPLTTLYLDYDKIPDKVIMRLFDTNDFSTFSNEFCNEFKSCIADTNQSLYQRLVNIDLKLRIRNFQYNSEKDEFDGITKINELGAEFFKELLVIRGTIVMISENKIRMKKAVFQCNNCAVNVPLDFNAAGGASLEKCFACGTENSFIMIPGQAVMTNTQVLTIEELSIDSSKNPVSIDVLIDGDLVNKFEVGEIVVVSGNLRLDVFNDSTIAQVKRKVSTNSYHYNMLSGFGGMNNGIEFDYIVEANYIRKMAEKSIKFHDLTDEEREKIEGLKKNPHLIDILVQSFAPKIYGEEIKKEALLYQLVGGLGRSIAPEIDNRGEIHILLFGDASCLVKGTKITMADGTQKSIETLGTQHLQSLDLDIIVNSKGDIGKAKVFHRYEKRQVIEIITDSGKSIKGTFDHPLLTINNEWKSLIELHVGEEIQILNNDFNYNQIKDNKILTNFNIEIRNDGPKYHGEIPEYYDDDLLSLLGYVLGDGYIHKYRLVYSIQDNELVDLMDKLSDLSVRLFNIKPILTIRKPSNRVLKNKQIISKNSSYIFEINSKDIASWFRFIKNKSKDRFIPEFIFQLSNRQIAIFLKWLFTADGTVFGNGERGKNAVSFKSSSLRLVRDIQQLLLRFNISARILENNEKYDLVIRKYDDFIKFKDNIGFEIKRKQDRLDSLVQIACMKKYKKPKKEYEKIVLKQFHFDLYDVYDIEVPEYHSFIANGLVSHNTGKTKLMLFSQQMSSKTRYGVGEGVSRPGLAGGVDTIDNKRVLTAGDAVMADMGLLVLDEVSDIPADALNALKEIMEKQTATTTKIRHGTFRTRTSILAGSNPKSGTSYNPRKNFNENIGLSHALMTRFDAIFLFRDIPGIERDQNIADTILRSYDTGKSPDIEGYLPKELLAKYIFLAKNSGIVPKLTPDANEVLRNFYHRLRGMNLNEIVESRLREEGDEVMAVSFSSRQFESLIRFATARTRLLFKKETDIQDAEAAIRIIDHMLKTIGVDIETGKIDMNSIFSTKSANQENKEHQFLSLLEKLHNAHPNGVPKELFIMELRKQSKWRDVPRTKIENEIRGYEVRNCINVINDIISLDYEQYHNR